jgi:hypothetical protein
MKADITAREAFQLQPGIGNSSGGSQMVGAVIGLLILVAIVLVLLKVAVAGGIIGLIAIVLLVLLLLGRL